MAHAYGSFLCALVASMTWAATPQEPRAGADPEVAHRAARAAECLSRADRCLKQALAGIRLGSRDEELLEEARDSLVEARRALVGMPERGLAIDPRGDEFAAEDGTAAPIPGSQGWLEVVAGELTRSGPRLEVRVFAGSVVIPSQTLAVGESLNFRFRDLVYELACVGARDHPRLVTSHDRIILRVRESTSPAAPTEVPVATVPESPPERPMTAMLLALVDARVGASAAESKRAEEALIRSDAEIALTAMATARERAQEAMSALVHLGHLAEGRKVWLIRDLALVRGRVTRVLPMTPPLDVEGLDPRERAGIAGIEVLGRGVARTLGMGRIELLVEQVLSSGRRYASRTKYGKASPDRRRADIAPGAVLPLEIARGGSGVSPLAQGDHCWVALTPPHALKLLPREYGTGDHVAIVLALPVVEQR